MFYMVSDFVVLNPKNLLSLQVGKLSGHFKRLKWKIIKFISRITTEQIICLVFIDFYHEQVNNLINPMSST